MLAQRAVVDALERVVARVGRIVDEACGRQHQRIGCEYDAVQEIKGRVGEAVGDRLEERGRIREGPMLERDVALHRHRAGGQAQGVAQGAVRIGKAEEKIAMLVVRRAGHDAPVADQHVHPGDGLVHQTILERRGLDADPRHRAAERNRLELGHDRGIVPWASVASARSTKVVMPSASTVPCAGSTASTASKCERSTRGLARTARSRNRFDVRLERPKPPPAPARGQRRGQLRLLLPRTAASPIEERAAHRVVGSDVALATPAPGTGGCGCSASGTSRRTTRDMCATCAGTARRSARVERVDRLPVGVEALGPGVERQRVVPAQVLDVDHLEAAALHRLDGLGEARYPAAGENVLADVELGVEHPDVADEVDARRARRASSPRRARARLPRAHRGRRAPACRSTGACRTGPASAGNRTRRA